MLNRFKVAKHFKMEIGDDSFTFSRKGEQIAAEAALDGIYVLRTSLADDVLETAGVVSSYKALAGVEHAFRTFNTDLDIRPIRHRSEDRVRCHVFLRMLSYYVAFHMRVSLAPMLFQDDDPESAAAMRPSPVGPAQRSAAALSKVTTKKTPDRLPAHSFKSLLADLATIAANRVKPADADLSAFTVITTPMTVQRRAFELLGVSHRFGYA